MKFKHSLFVDEYFIDFNATQAAIRAGYKPKSAKKQGYRLLHDKEIKKAIAERQAQLRAANPNGVYEILEFLTAAMRGNVIECIPLFKGKGKQEYQNGKPRTSDRLKAAELLGKYYGMFTDKQQTNSGGNVIIINDIPNNRE